MSPVISFPIENSFIIYGDRLRKYLEAKGWWSADEDTALRSTLRKEILQAFSRAEKVKKPPIKELFLDIYEEPSEDLIEQMAELKSIIEKYPEEYDLDSHEGGKVGL